MDLKLKSKLKNIFSSTYFSNTDIIELRDKYNIDIDLKLFEKVGNTQWYKLEKYDFNSDIDQVVKKMLKTQDQNTEQIIKKIIKKEYSTKIKTYLTERLKFPGFNYDNTVLKPNKIFPNIIDVFKKNEYKENFNTFYKVKVKDIKKFFTPRINIIYDDIEIKLNQQQFYTLNYKIISDDFSKGTSSDIIITKVSNFFIEKIEDIEQKNLGKKLLAIGATSIIISVVGGIVYLAINSKSSSKNQVERDINEQIENSAKDKSGCFLVDKSTGKSFKIDLLSCTPTKNTNYLQTCLLSDKECTNKFNPCLRDPSNPIPSDCKRLVVSSLSDRKGVSEYLACSKENKYCSKYCQIDNFNYDQNRFDMECRSVDSSILKLEFVSLVSGVPVSKLLNRMSMSSNNSRVIVLEYVVWIINLILLVSIVYLTTRLI